MHILHIYKDYDPVLGGIENHVKVLAEGLAARGHTVTVLVTNTAPHSTVHCRGSLTIVKASRQWHFASTPLSLTMPLFARMARNVDVVHLHFPYPPGDLVAMAVGGRPPWVITYHSDIVRQQAILWVYRPLLARTLDRAARIIVTSPRYICSSPWLRSRSEKCAVSPLSVDLDRFASDGAGGEKSAALRARYGQPLLLFVGKLRYYKGLHFLLEAMLQLRHRARLLIVGTGPEEPRLRNLAYTLGIADRVVFVGEVRDADLPAYYHAASLFVLPSHLRSEAFGIVQVEAQAAALPVICTEIGTGTSYVTLHGQTGLVVPPADPSALARAIDDLLDDPDLARQMGQRGRNRAEREFSHTRMIERVEGVYREVVAGRDKKGSG